MLTAQALFFCDTTKQFIFCDGVIAHTIESVKKPIDGSGWKQQISQHFFMNILFDDKMAQKKENFEQSCDQY